MKKSLHSNEHDQLLFMLRETRLSAGKTQSALAAQLSKPQSFVAKYEGGERRLDIVELIMVLRALGVSPPEFISELCRQIP